MPARRGAAPVGGPRATWITGSVAAWRASFPHAKEANFYGGYRRRSPIVDADFVHFEGLQELDMSYCRQVTDTAFVHLKGIRKLIMWCCFQNTITDAAFAHLKGIHTLDMRQCSQATITVAAFSHLAGISSIRIEGCSAAAIAAAKAAGLRVLQLN